MCWSAAGGGSTITVGAGDSDTGTVGAGADGSKITVGADGSETGSTRAAAGTGGSMSHTELPDGATVPAAPPRPAELSSVEVVAAGDIASSSAFPPSDLMIVSSLR
jgi:hypothetical protein